MGFQKIFHIGNRFYKNNYKILSKLCRVWCKIVYQCDIPMNANISEDVYFCHNAFGVVINPNSFVGGGTTIQHSVTIGEIDTDHKSPVIGNNVYIGARAVILGDIKIGNNAKIGAGAIVLTDVPENCTAVGVPAKIINNRGE